MRLLLVEDERELADTLARGLQREGYDALAVYDGDAALAAFAQTDYDLMILDRDLPGTSGDAVCRTLRLFNNPVRILMLTAAATTEDLITGLDLGADDYLPKPFDYAELMARLRALGRRVENQAQEVLESSGIWLDSRRRLVKRNGVTISLGRREFEVLEALMISGGYLSVDELLKEIWRGAEDRNPSVVKATVHTLRKRLGEPNIIYGRQGFGYRLGEEND